jgi:hypothetical protein
MHCALSTQKLVTEIERLKIVLYLVSRRKQHFLIKNFFLYDLSKALRNGFHSASISGAFYLRFKSGVIASAQEVEMLHIIWDREHR